MKTPPRVGRSSPGGVSDACVRVFPSLEINSRCDTVRTPCRTVRPGAIVPAPHTVFRRPASGARPPPVDRNDDTTHAAASPPRNAGPPCGCGCESGAGIQWRGCHRGTIREGQRQSRPPRRSPVRHIHRFPTRKFGPRACATGGESAWHKMRKRAGVSRHGSPALCLVTPATACSPSARPAGPPETDLTHGRPRSRYRLPQRPEQMHNSSSHP